MIISDSHMHTSFSGDSKTDMEDMIKSAISKGLKHICFTEHLDFDYPNPTQDPELNFIVDLPAYQKRLFELKALYEGKIEVLFGIEFGLLPWLADRYEQVAKSYNFDFIIASSHLLEGKDPYYPEFFDNRDELICYRQYFESIIDNMKVYQSFNTYGHLDYIVRYGPNQNKFYRCGDYTDVIDTILKTLIRSDKALEINTSGFKYQLGQPHPHYDIISRYKELGGELLTIGSDAHAPEYIAYEFEKINIFLTNLGFKYYTLYKDFQPVMLPL